LRLAAIERPNAGKPLAQPRSRKIADSCEDSAAASDFIKTAKEDFFW
jgi:hypothetical protein